MKRRELVYTKEILILDNDTERFAWADDQNGKGVIYRMIHEGLTYEEALQAMPTTIRTKKKNLFIRIGEALEKNGF